VCDVGGEVRVGCEEKHVVVILGEGGSSPIEG
jgi:hypothetical protein